MTLPRGHAAKLEDAFTALRDAGQLPPSLRPVERYWRVRAWLESAGYRGRELPSKWTVARHLELMRQMLRQP
jgi:hypothetical protein